jgi:hypothetical protein
LQVAQDPSVNRRPSPGGRVAAQARGHVHGRPARPALRRLQDYLPRRSLRGSCRCTSRQADSRARTRSADYPSQPSCTAAPVPQTYLGLRHTRVFSQARPAGVATADPSLCAVVNDIARGRLTAPEYPPRVVRLRDFTASPSRSSLTPKRTCFTTPALWRRP